MALQALRRRKEKVLELMVITIFPYCNAKN